MIKFFWIPKEVWYYVVFPIFGILIFYMIFNLFYSKKKGFYYYNYVVDYVYSSLATIFCGLLFCLLLGYSIATLQILNTNNLMRAYPFLTILLIILPLIPTGFLIYVISVFYNNLNRKERLDARLESKINGDDTYSLKSDNMIINVPQNDDHNNIVEEQNHKQYGNDDNNLKVNSVKEEIDDDFVNELTNDNENTLDDNNDFENINSTQNLSEIESENSKLGESIKIDSKNIYFSDEDYIPKKIIKDNVGNDKQNELYKTNNYQFDRKENNVNNKIDLEPKKYYNKSNNNKNYYYHNNKNNKYFYRTNKDNNLNDKDEG